MPSTSVQVADSAPALQRPPTHEGRSSPSKVTGKLAVAIDIMIEAGQPWDKAAVQAGLTVRSMRLAMQRPHVISYLKGRREVFRVNACAGNIHRLVKVADSDKNAMAIVAAVKALEQIGADQVAGAGAAALPGLQIVIVQGSNQSSIDARLTQPAIDHQQMRVIADG